MTRPIAIYAGVWLITIAVGSALLARKPR